MVVFRIAARPYAGDLSGRGSSMYGGRWNPKGIPMLYTSATLSLAALELAVNLPPGRIPNHYHAVEISIPKKSITAVNELPEQWNGYPYVPATQQIGRQFIKSDGFVLKVPSAVISTEYNYLINPNHPDMSSVRIKDQRPFLFDSRLK
ncbi:MAG: RES family NAD+ phosphorylase [Cyclobacteriaceae bacterium]